jgi:hypothetical protein
MMMTACPFGITGSYSHFSLCNTKPRNIWIDLFIAGINCVSICVHILLHGLWLWVCHAHSHVNTHCLQYYIGVVLTDVHCLAGSAIEASLKQLAERRTDIFGVGDEETAIGKKIGEEDKRKDEKVR